MMAPSGTYLSSARLSELADEQVATFASAGCTRATEHLLKKYRGLVELKARSYFVAGAEPDDVVQEGMIGLYKAIRDFRAEKLAHFRCFVELCVTRQIVTAVKSAIRNKHLPLNNYVSLQAQLVSGESGTILDLIADKTAQDPERILLEKCTLQGAASAAEDLTDFEMQAWQGYADGKTYHQLAAELRKPAKSVDNALQRAKRKIGRRLIELN